MSPLILSCRAAAGTPPSPLPAHSFDPVRQLNTTPAGLALVETADVALLIGYTGTQDSGGTWRTDD